MIRVNGEVTSPRILCRAKVRSTWLYRTATCGTKLTPDAATLVPWFVREFKSQDRSVCKGRWLAIRHGIKICYAQWEDVGPFRTDQAEYAFGDGRPGPNANQDAGIDVSPSIRDYLGLGSLDRIDWKFVEENEVPVGPWSISGRAATTIAASR